MSRRSITLVGAAVAALLVAAVVAIPLLSGDDDKVVRTGSASSTTSSIAVAPDGGAALPFTSSTTPAGGATVTTTRSATSGGGGANDPGLGDPKDPGPAAPARAGSYTYNQTKDGSTQQTTTKVETLSTSGSTVQQRITVTDDQVGSIANDVTWTPDSVTVTKSSIGGADCDWAPDSVQYKLPLAKGLTWDVDSTCDTTFAGQPTKLHRVARAEVVDLVRIKVAGQVLDTWVVRRTEKLDAEGGTFTSHTDTTTTEHVSPRHGLVVRSETTGRSTATFGGGTRNNDVDTKIEIADLNPK